MKDDIARVHIIDLPYYADKLYDYLIPFDLLDRVEVGSLITVSLGVGNKRMSAVVREIVSTSNYSELKSVLSVSGTEPLLDKEQLEMCDFLKEHTLCTYGEAVRTVVPAAAFSKITSYLEANPEKRYEPSGKDLTDRAVFVLKFILDNGKCPMSKLISEFGDDVSKDVSLLVKKKYVLRTSRVTDSTNVKTVTYVSPKLSKEDVADIVSGVSAIRLRSAGQLSALQVLCETGEIGEDELCSSAGCTRVHISSLEKKGLVSTRKEEVTRNPYSVEKVDVPEIILSEEQQNAYDKLEKLYLDDAPRAALLFGVTGSGKTSVIKKLMDRARADGRGVIMLVPEIALTPQAVAVFCSYYGDDVSVLHSGLSNGERYDAYRRIRDGRSSIVIGTRSAIFAPLKNVGLIVIDEEQEHTYKSDSDPKYSAHDVARFRCGESGAMLLLSSATPSIGSFYKAVNGKYELVELKNRYGGATLPKVKICDMRRESAAGNDSPVSGELLEELEATRAKGEQAIVLLNRRGYNNSVACMHCGESVKCPNCSVSMTFHTYSLFGDSEVGGLPKRGRRGYLVCHYCGHKEAVPTVCPSCGAENFRYVGCGTQKVEEEITKLIPGIKVSRMDMDTTSTKFSHAEILESFRRGEADVLLGTQMVAKGHDFPKVTLVGVMGADASLYIEDYRGSERTFSMLTQVIGRAGRRGGDKGVAVVQTLNPDSNVIRDAALQDYRRFYEREISLRRSLAFPPFCDIVLLTLSSSDEPLLSAATARLSERLREYLSGEYRDIEFQAFGPFENPIYRLSNVCRMRMVLKCRVNRRVRELLSVLLFEFGKVGIKRLSLSVDINPNSI
ncbi:MAG: primosomal protein N' [Clostridia bacterium]|nr:primosomal protein N' [Clostridia bacterium]